MSKSDEILNSSDEDYLTFSIDQVKYLREEFERQRRWVNLLLTREQKMLQELDRTKNSVSYRIGRFLTSIPRSVIKGVVRKRIFPESTFVGEEEEGDEQELFPSSLVISPELLPSDSKMRKSDKLVEGILIAIRRGSLTVDAARDLVAEESFSMRGEDVFRACQKKCLTSLTQTNINQVSKMFTLEF